MAEKMWVLKSQGDPEESQSLSKELKLPPVIASLLVQRGVNTPEKVNEFFNPSLKSLHDPFLMKDMDKAVSRLERALRDKEAIMIYGDYDVDGITAVALMYRFISRLSGGNKIYFYIPDRYNDGYGISTKSIDYAQEKGVKLIIALDCGIKAVSQVDYAQERGIDYIICDHHRPDDTLPCAAAILNPKREDCNYPFKHLSGCGVGFKFACAYNQKNNIDFQDIADLLDLLVVSIASDIVPIIGENRILAYYGLKQLNENPCKGLGAIIKICHLEDITITIDDIVFKIGPRINAAGRMENDPLGDSSSGGNNAVKLLKSNSVQEATEYGKIIDSCNTDRKEVDREITKEANKIVDGTIDVADKKCTVIYNPNWMKGVVGIVASRLIERYYRPTVVLTKSKEFITGSARSIKGFDLYQAIESCSKHLENFGGHTYAAGLTLREENLEAFIKDFEAYVDANIDTKTLIPQVDVDMEIDFSTITDEMIYHLKKFHPFGPGNSNPIFMTRRVMGDGDIVGKRYE
ncbi:MAG: single-stranded-DNA-specific exonuclease RecJ, partial [Rikenellaceae bacterium]